ncbi:DUF1493 family protein [Citrobacter sedlakii]|uniref:DUF1493 family protein n=1 Tax=Citrobacter sedlakii TaxID=67826 RepID=UPI0035AB92DD
MARSTVRTRSGIIWRPGEDIHNAHDRYEKGFLVDLSCVNWKPYFPWENTPKKKGAQAPFST